MAALMPALVCAVCPACLSLYAKLGATLGVGIVLTESQHAWILGLAVTVSLLVSLYRSLRTGHIWPLMVAAAGCGLLVLGHQGSGARAMEWAGIGVLLIGGLAEQFLLTWSSAPGERGRGMPAH